MPPAPRLGGCPFAAIGWARSVAPRRRRPAIASNVACTSPAIQFGDTRADIAAKRHDLQIGPAMQKLRGAAQRGRAHHHALGQRRDRRADGTDQRIARIFALRHADQRDPIGQHRRQILQRMHGQRHAAISRAASISLVKRPLPPISTKVRSCTVSPLVDEGFDSDRAIARQSRMSRRQPCLDAARLTRASGLPRVPMRKGSGFAMALF